MQGGALPQATQWGAGEEEFKPGTAVFQERLTVYAQWWKVPERLQPCAAADG